jgi:hypothetical protein
LAGQVINDGISPTEDARLKSIPLSTLINYVNVMTSGFKLRGGKTGRMQSMTSDEVKK